MDILLKNRGVGSKRKFNKRLQVLGRQRKLEGNGIKRNKRNMVLARQGRKSYIWHFVLKKSRRNGKAFIFHIEEEK